MRGKPQCVVAYERSENLYTFIKKTIVRIHITAKRIMKLPF